MKISAFEVHEWERKAFEPLRGEHEVKLVEQPLSKDNADDHGDADIISTFIYSDLDRQVLEAFEGLKLIATRSTGFDHIDTDYCAQRDITVCNVPDYGKNTVAEHTFALLLALSRNIVPAAERTRHGDFSFRGLRGFDLRGKTLGVIGTGDIGQFVIRIARGFGMQVIAFDIEPNDQLCENYDFHYAPLDELLGAADVVTLHVPETPETHHMISADQFAAMKDGAVLLNTARAGAVDIDALLRALATGKVAAVGLDVLPREEVICEEDELLRRIYEKKNGLDELLANQMLMRLPNVLVTPHSAFYTTEAVERILDTTIANIRSFVAGEAKNAVLRSGDD